MRVCKTKHQKCNHYICLACVLEFLTNVLCPCLGLHFFLLQVEPTTSHLSFITHIAKNIKKCPQATVKIIVWKPCQCVKRVQDLVGMFKLALPLFPFPIFFGFVFPNLLMQSHTKILQQSRIMLKLLMP